MLANRLLSVSVLSRNLIKSARNYAVNITMDKHQVVPDVIPVAPSEVAKVNYVSGVTANEGNELTPTQVKDEPKVEWTADANSLYTLCMTDPDAPSRQDPKFREVRFFLKSFSCIFRLKILITYDYDKFILIRLIWFTVHFKLSCMTKFLF